MERSLSENAFQTYLLRQMIYWSKAINPLAAVTWTWKGWRFESHVEFKSKQKSQGSVIDLKRIPLDISRANSTQKEVMVERSLQMQTSHPTFVWCEYIRKVFYL